MAQVKRKGSPYLILALGPEVILVWVGYIVVYLTVGWHFFTRPVVTFPAREHHCHLAGTKLYCLVTEAHVCEQLGQR